MNFSEKSTTAKIKQLRLGTSRLSSKVNVWFFRLFLVFFVALMAIGVFGVYGVIRGLATTTPKIEEINVMPSGYKTTFYYNDGSVSQTLISAGANRVYVTYDQIPKQVSDCFVAIEDERFYVHKGIDVRSIFRAVYEAVTSMSLGGSGGSTITQQLLKNQVFGGGQEETTVDKIVRKIQEQFLAVSLENKYSKELILEYYLNSLNLGNGSYGIQTAAQNYFGKDVFELTLSEAACLAAIPKGPSIYGPVSSPEKNAERREVVLRYMLEFGWCTQEEYDEAVADTEDLYKRIDEVVNRTYVDASSLTYSYFTDEVITQLIKDLQELGYTSTQAVSMIYSGGLEVYTTQDPEIQNIVDTILADDSLYPELGKGSYYELTYAISVRKADGTVIHYQLNDLLKYHNYFENDDKVMLNLVKGVYYVYFFDKDYCDEKTKEFRDSILEAGDTVILERNEAVIQPQVSFSMMDHKTGAVVALTGGRHEKTANRTLNRATTTLRQVGSTFKVLASYVPAIDMLGMTLATPIEDYPYFYAGTDTEVNNWYKTAKTKFYGVSYLKRGIFYSMNILAVKTMEMVTPAASYEYLKKLGFTTIVDRKVNENGAVMTDLVLPLALGSLTDGVTNIEMTAAYATIANGGLYNKPYYYTKVYDHNGNLLISHEAEPKQVMKNSTAFLLTNAMESVVSDEGTGRRAKFTESKVAVAGKTGSTTNNVDFWFCGYTPYYTASIWAGFDNNLTQDDSYERVIWAKIMETVQMYKALPDVPFEVPNSVVKAKICTKSGKLAIDGICDKAQGGSTVSVEYFAIGTVPTDYCDCHIKVKLCRESGELACENCVRTVERILFLHDEPVIYYPTEYDLTTNPPKYDTTYLQVVKIDKETGEILEEDENGEIIKNETAKHDRIEVVDPATGEVVDFGYIDETTGEFVSEKVPPLKHPKNYVLQPDGTYKSPDGIFTLHPNGTITSVLGTFFINDDMKTMTSADGEVYLVDGMDVGYDEEIIELTLDPTIGDIFLRTNRLSRAEVASLLGLIYPLMEIQTPNEDIARIIYNDNKEYYDARGINEGFLKSILEVGRPESLEKIEYLYSTEDTNNLVPKVVCTIHSEPEEEITNNVPAYIQIQAAAQLQDYYIRKAEEEERLRLEEEERLRLEEERLRLEEEESKLEDGQKPEDSENP
ncbi:MAG: transglycosylase domain-containing protein [Lachnospiraceae bacterium]|nr:transglycosylase domain-containing protein [Lachnospiraceae bacterium]